MFEILFKDPKTIARYRAAAHAGSCERFLEDCARQGYSHAMLCKIAWILLAVTPGIHVDGGEVSLHGLEFAVDHRTQFQPRTESTNGFQSSRRMFIHITTEWLRSIGCVVRTSESGCRFASELDAFTRYLHEERGLSQATIATRRIQLTCFFRQLPVGRDSLHAVTIADVDGFIEDRRHHGWTRASMVTLANSLRSFFYYAKSQRWCQPAIAAAIDMPRVYAQEGIPRGPRWDDVQRLLASAEGERPVDIRDRAVMMLLSLYGLRRGEVAALCLDDLDWTNERILVTRTKRRCQQSYPLVLDAGEAILLYLREARPQCTHRALFLTLAAPWRPLSGASISAIVRARLTALDITLPTRGAHCLRHACASRLLDSGFSLKQIGDHLGHRSVNSTLRYAKVDMAGLRQVAELDLGGVL